MAEIMLYSTTMIHGMNTNFNIFPTSPPITTYLYFLTVLSTRFLFVILRTPSHTLESFFILFYK